MSVFTQQERIAILADLVAIKSVNGDETKVANYLADLFGKYGINAKLIPITDTRANLFAEIGTGKPVLTVSGHMDVVDPGDLSFWDTDPFKLTEKDGKLFGRGATDMKSGLAALVIAMIELKQAQTPLQGTIKLLATVGEEIGEVGSHTFYEQGYMTDADALLIAEPSGYNIVHAEKGSMDLKLTATGVTVHSSMPEQGFNAINSLISVLAKANHTFHSSANPTSPLFGPMSFNVDTIKGGAQINSIPDTASVEVNVRTIPEYNGSMVLSQLSSIINTYNTQYATTQVPKPVSMDIMMNEPPVEAPVQNTLITQTQKITKAQTNQSLPVIAMAGVTDASNLLKDKPTDFPFIMFGPGETNQAHVINEYVYKDMYLNFIEIYIQLFSHANDD